jgi:hypothetical protein
VRAATACMVRARSSLAVRIVCGAWAAACLVQGGGVAESDVLAQIVAFEEDAGLIGEPLGGDPSLLGVDADHAPAVTVADLVDPMTTAVGCAGFDGHCGIVVAAQHEITRTDLLIAGGPSCRARRVAGARCGCDGELGRGTRSPHGLPGPPECADRRRERRAGLAQRAGARRAVGCRLRGRAGDSGTRPGRRRRPAGRPGSARAGGQGVVGGAVVGRARRTSTTCSTTNSTGRWPRRSSVSWKTSATS